MPDSAMQVNNAVQFVFGHLGEAGSGSGSGTDKGISMEDWRKALDTNVVGYALCIQHAVPFMKRNELTEVR